MRNEQTSQLHEARYRTLIEVSPQGIWSARPDGYVTFCNQWWLDYTGLDMQALEGSGWTQAVHADHRQRILKVWLAAAARGADYEVEIPVRRAADGIYRWHLVRGLPLRDGQAACIKEWIGIAIDIHDRKQAEQNAAQTEAHLRLVLDSMPQKIFTANVRGEVDYFNPQWSAFTGLTFETIRAWGWTQFIHPDDVEMNVRLWQTSIETGQPFQFEHRFRRADGAYRWHLSRAVPVRDDAGQVIMWVGANTDINDQKQAEATVRDDERRFRDLADTAPAMLWITNADAACAFLSRGWYEFTGQTEAEGLGFGWIDAVHPEDRAEAARVYGAANKSRAPLTVDYRLRRADGEYHWATDLGRPRFDADGEFLGYIGSVIDISERKQAEQEIIALNDALEQRVIERTAQLEAANREIEAFSYSVSHDLRAPLRAIDGFSRSLLHDYGDRLDERGLGDLERVRTAAQRMGQLIDDLLTLSRLTRRDMRLTHVDLTRLARDAAEECRTAEPSRKVELIIEPGLTATADPQLTRVALDNLIGNAWKFTGRQPGARIEIGAEPHEHGARFYVRDNGCGFDMSYADKLFGAFQRLHTRTEFDGTGIGLATVQRIVHRHGGHIWAQAAVGEGATFYFTLSPAGEAEAGHA